MDQTLKKSFDNFEIVRNKNISLINSIPEQALMVIPNGFSNNIFWHLGHIITVQESLTYRRSGLAMHIDKSYLTYFAKGTSPADFDTHIPTIKELLSQSNKTMSHLKSEMGQHAEIQYPKAIEVSFGLTLESFSDAVCTLPFHEAYHLSSMNLLKKFLK